VFASCPVSACLATVDKDALASRGDFDAVLFHPLDVPQHVQTNLTFSWRRPHQLFVMVYMESPQLYPQALKPFPYFFNWTMSYLWESDIPRPYGYFVPHGSSFTYAHLPDQWISYSSQNQISSSPDDMERIQRPYQVAWIVSNCKTPSRREDYVKELAKHINVTIFGKCSNTSSIINTNLCDDECYEYIRHNYKFVLGLENSHCRDYVTEKFFGRVSDHVVITQGRPRGAPPHSYISIQDYDTPAELAAYLQALDADDDAYRSYFWWKEFYEVRSAPGKTSDHVTRSTFFAQSMCRLCEKLHLDNKSPSVYPSVADWHAAVGQCTTTMAHFFNENK
jgi:hypothetical protein